MSWKVTLPCTRAEAEALAGEVPAIDALSPPPSLVTSEEDEAADRWRLDAYFETRPDAAAIAVLVGAVPSAAGGRFRAEKLDDADWVTISQSGLEPVRAGRFFVHTGNDAPDGRAGVINLRIDAGQAFGTGHHETTGGCLAAIDRFHREGARFRHIADIGTGTGLLAFAALKLWPRAWVLASDIDPVSIATTEVNAGFNQLGIGQGPGRVSLIVADGTDNAAISGRAPFDLICANILAGPLITLAPALAAIAAPGGRLVLAGLLAKQREAVIAAYRRAGFRVDDRGGDAEWPALTMTMRQRLGWRRPIRANGRGGLPPGDYGSW